MSEEEKVVETTEVKEDTGPLFKYVHLKSGDRIVAMVEWAKDNSGIITFYNPMRVSTISAALEAALADKLGGLPGGSLPTFMLEEWLPPQIVREQLCQVFEEDVLTMVDLSDKFLKVYTSTIMKKVQLEEIAKKGGLKSSRMRLEESMMMSEEEENEMADQEFQEVLEEGMKDFKKNLN